MGALASGIGAIIGSIINQDYSVDDIKSGITDFVSSVTQSSSSTGSSSSNNVSSGSVGIGGGKTSTSTSNIENKKSNAQELVKKYGTTEEGLQSINRRLGYNEKVSVDDRGNVYFASGGQEYLIGGKDYGKVQFYNGLAAGGAGSSVMSSINQTQKQIDDYVSQLADYRASLQSSAEDAARQAYVNQQLAQKSLRNNFSRYGLVNSGYYQKNQQSLKNDYETALEEIQRELSAGLSEAKDQESSIRQQGADALSEILANNGLLNEDTIEFAQKEFPVLRLSKVSDDSGVFQNKQVPSNQKSSQNEDVSEEEFAQALNSDVLGNYRDIVNYVADSANTQEQIARVAELVNLGFPQNLLVSIVQRLLDSRQED